MNPRYTSLCFLFLSCLLLVLLSSCNPAFQAQQDMLLTVSEKGDLKATGSINKTKVVTDESIYLNGQVAYSPIKHLGLSASYFKNRESLDQGYDYSSGQIISRELYGNQIDFAVGGYYSPKLKDVQTNTKGFLMPKKVTTDLYVGGGFGETTLFDVKSSSSNFKFNRYFAQVGVHFQWKIVKASYAFRIVNLDFESIYKEGDLPTYVIDQIDLLAAENPVFYRSSSFRMQMGPRYAQFYVDMNFNNMPEYLKEAYFYEKIGGVGVIVDINEFYKKINDNENDTPVMGN